MNKNILSITVPELLFPNDLELAKQKFHKLSLIYHPDVNDSSDAVDKFQHLTLLYKEVQEKIKNGTWALPGTIQFQDKISSTKYQIKYRKHHTFELGDMYISDTIVAYIVDKKHKLLFDNAVSKIKGIKYASDKMKQDFIPYMPEIVKTFETKNDKFGMIVKKTPDVLLLKDVLSYYKKVHPKHVAWIMSRLHNLCCFFHYNDISHNGLTLENLFISPAHHSCLVLGGWWFTQNNDKKLIGCTKEVYKLLPLKVKDTKICSDSIDLECIRYVGRSLLGDSVGTTLKEPEPMVKWLKLPSPKDAFDDYEKWQKVLTDSFGPRKFVKMELTADDIYKK